MNLKNVSKSPIRKSNPISIDINKGVKNGSFNKVSRI